MKRFAAPLLMFNALVLTLGISCLNHRTEPPRYEHRGTENCTEGNKRVFNIGVLIYGHSPASEALIAEFERAFEKATGSKSALHLYNANENYALLTSMATTVLAGEYDLTWIIGLQAAQAVAGMLSKQCPSAPLMLSNVSWDKIKDLAEENPLLKTYAAGWGGSYDWPRRISILKRLAPETKRALFLYSTSRDPSCLDEVKAELDRHGITHEEIGIDDTATTFNYVRNTLTKVDIIIVLGESGVVPAVDKLVMLGNNYHVPVLASDGTSVERGAACGIFPDQRNVSHYCVWFAKEILLNKKKPAELSFIHVRDWDIKAVLNKNTSNEKFQNTRTPANIEFLLKHSIVTGKSNKKHREAPHDI